MSEVTPGKYLVEWSATVGGASVVEILPEDITSDGDLKDAAFKAIEAEGYPTGYANEIDDFQISNITLRAENVRENVRETVQNSGDDA